MWVRCTIYNTTIQHNIFDFMRRNSPQAARETETPGETERRGITGVYIGSGSLKALMI
jgi:hypothetical protein